MSGLAGLARDRDSLARVLLVTSTAGFGLPVKIIFTVSYLICGSILFDLQAAASDQ